MNDVEEELMRLCAETCLGCDGVSSMVQKHGASDYLKGKAGIDPAERGVRITKDKKDMVIDLYLRVRYGENIPVLAWNIQHSVLETLKDKTEYRIKAVNIHIKGVDL